MPTTPSGCGISRLRAGRNCSAVATRCGAIQLFKCFVACRTSENTIIVSAILVSTAERWPKSAEIACRKRSSLSATTARKRASRSSRAAQSGAGSARDRATMAWKLSVSAASGALARGRSKVLFKAVLPKSAFRLCFVAASWRFAELLASVWQIGRNPRPLAVIKSKKTPAQPFPKPVRVGTYPSHPTGFGPGLPSSEAFGTGEASHANSVGPDPPSPAFQRRQSNGLTRGGAAR